MESCSTNFFVTNNVDVMSEMSPSCRKSRLSELAVVACLLSAVALFGFRELVQNPNHLLVGAHRNGENDLTAYFVRTLDSQQQHFSQRQIPGWNPYLSLGSPTWGNPQSLLFYPPNWLCWWLGASAAGWLMVAHHWWAGLGAYVWARQLDTRRTSALIAGVVATLAPYAIGHTAEGHYPQTCVMAWLPWTLWAFERFLASGYQKWLAVSVCLSLSFLAGHVQESFYLAVLMSGTLAVQILATKRLAGAATVPGTAAVPRPSGSGSDHQTDRPLPNGRGTVSSPKGLATWSLVGAMTIGLVLVELLPTLRNSQLSVRASGLPLSLAGDGLKSRHVQQLWNVHVFDANPQANPFGWEFCFHFGVAPAALVVLALLLGRRRPETWRIVWMLAITIAFAFGATSPLFRLCYSWLPGFSSFRSPARVLYLSSTLVAVLAAIGWDSLWPRLWDQQSTRKVFVSFASVLMAIVTAGELGLYAQQVLATTPMTALRQNSSISDFLRTQPDHPRVLTGGGLYSDRETQRDGVQKILGYEPFMFLRYGLFFDALTTEGSKLDPAGFQPPRFRDVHKPLIDLAGVRFAVMPGMQRDIPGWKRVHSGMVVQEISLPGQPRNEWPFAILENQTVMPRAFVIGHVTQTGESVRGQSLPQQLEKIDPRTTLLLQRDLWSSDQPRSPFTAATIESYSDNEVRIQATATGHGYLVLTDMFHPGWSATVDGQPTTILPANIAFRAVPLTPGPHEIVFRFTVPGAKVGTIVSVCSWLAAIALAVCYASRTRGNR